MTKEEAKRRIQKLRETIEYHRYLYHVLDRQEISDAALDSLKHELYKLESQYPDLITSTSPTQRVGGVPLEKFVKVSHRSPMLSMEDVFSFEELVEWEERLVRFRGIKPHSYYTEVKMDGLAASLLYRNGQFEAGITRGNGKIGENVTHNVKTIQAIPLHLRTPHEKELRQFIDLHKGTLDEKKLKNRLSDFSGVIEIRGEVYMSKKSFASLNERQKKKGDQLFANPRNAAAGSIRQLDSNLVASRELDFFGYALQDEETFGVQTHEQAHSLLRLLGIKTNALSKTVLSLEEVKKQYEAIQRKRERLPYWIDGIVVVVNENDHFRSLGVVGKAPRGIVAYKFPAEQVTTVITQVDFQVGRTGVLTPVATFEPVSVAGTTVTHATLHNTDEIERLGVKLGDTVIIEKAGDIIPKVVSVVKSMRVGKETKISIPDRCPVCEAPVLREQGKVALMCQNKNCFAKGKEALIHFVSKKGFDIDGLGEKIVEQLLNQGLIRTAADLFTLTQGDLEPLERFAQKSAENLCKAIAERKKIELSRCIYALGIFHVGEETAFDLAKQFGTLEKLKNASLQDIERIENIGPIVAQSVVDYFTHQKNREFIETLLERGVTVLPFTYTHAQNLTRTVFVITGSLSSLNRDEAEKLIRERGGSVSSQVSKKTQYVVVGVDPGSKEKAAKKLGIRIIHEKEFLELLKK